MHISMAPIQGITDFRFRNVFNQHFKGVDFYYAPYIRMDKGLIIPKARQKDVDPKNNEGLNLIPQVMSNDVDELLFLSQYLSDLGYTEMNWNLGCPYPMVTKRKLGAGMIPEPDMVNSLLGRIMPELKLKMSVKLRMGLFDYSEIDNLIPVLNQYPLKEIILHPRIGKDLYKNLADKNGFERVRSKFTSPLAYNGDINSKDDFQNLIQRFPEVNHVMLGRGLIANPFLSEEIIGTEIDADEKVQRFRKFHDLLLAEVSGALSGHSHIITRMRSYWEYFAQSFADPHKVFKLVKKSTSLDKYDGAVRRIIQENEWLT